MRLALFRFRWRFPPSQPARSEAMALTAVALLFLVALVPALSHARREYRDGVRRELLRTVKTELEHIYNERGSFPLHPSGDLGLCGGTDDPDDWFFSQTLVVERKGTSIHPPGNRHRYPLRYCPTSMMGGEAVPPSAAGFYLEALLENAQPDLTRFNTEYNIAERTLTVGGQPAYRICGGNETQCGTATQ